MGIEDVFGKVTFEEIENGELQAGVMLITEKGVYFPPAYYLSFMGESREGMVLRCGLTASNILANVVAAMVVNEHMDSETIIDMVTKAIAQAHNVVVDKTH